MPHPEPADVRRASRRTLLRSGAHAAWTAPLVATATAAPAFALSGDPTLQIVDQRFWVTDALQHGGYGVVPIVVVKNPLPRVAVYPEIWFSFPTASFTGAGPASGSAPPWPQFVSGTGLSGWTAYFIDPPQGATAVQVYLKKNTTLRAGQTAFVGDPAAFNYAFAWAFANRPTVPSIPFQVRAVGLDTVPGVLARMDPPAH